MEKRLNNYDRLYREIRQAADLHARSLSIDPAELVELVMRIVDLEDQNRIKAVARIRQQVENMIETAAASRKEEGR